MVESLVWFGDQYQTILIYIIDLKFVLFFIFILYIISVSIYQRCWYMSIARGDTKA